MKQKDFSMNEAMKELEAINTWFQEEDIDLEEGLKKLQRAGELTQDIKARLQTVENQFIELKNTFQEELNGE